MKRLLNVFRFAHNKKNNCVFLEINEKSLFLSLISRTKNGDLFTARPHIITLNRQSTINGRLFNISLITTTTEQFIQDNNLKKPSITVSLNALYAKNEVEKNLITLQIALCMSKTSGTLTTILDTSLLGNNSTSTEYPLRIENKTDTYNYLSQLKGYNEHSPTGWLITTGTLLIISSLFLYKTQNIIVYTLYAKQKIKKQLNQDKDRLQEKLTSQKDLEAKITTLKKQQQILEKISVPQPSPTQTLQAIARTIPNDSWITAITFTKETKNNKNGPPTSSVPPIQIQGTTKQPQSITTFMKKLGKYTPFKNARLTSIQKLKKDKTTSEKRERLYNFSINT